MAYFLNPGALLAVASGLAMAVLGASVLHIRPWRPAGFAFSVFAIVWGVTVVAGNMGQLAADPATALPWAELLLALDVVLYVPLLYFASAFPRPSNALARDALALAMAALPGLVLLLLAAASPQLFVRGIAPDSRGVLVTVPGPLLQVALGMSVLPFVLALAITARNLRLAPPGAAQDQLALVVAALLAYVSYRASDLVPTALLGAADFVARQGALPFAFRAGVESAALVGAALVLAWAARRPGLPWRGLLLACGTVPFAVGLLEALLASAGIAGFQTVGLWRLAMVGLFAYAIARYRMFDIDLKLGSAVPAAAFAAFAALGTDVLWSLAWAPITQSPILGTFASAGVSLAMVPVVRVARRAVKRAAPHLEEPDYLYKRKLAVYRVALEEARERGGSAPEEERFLADLRHRLGISEQEHRVLAAVAAAPPGQARPRVARSRTSPPAR